RQGAGSVSQLFRPEPGRCYLSVARPLEGSDVDGAHLRHTDPCSVDAGGYVDPDAGVDGWARRSEPEVSARSVHEAWVGHARGRTHGVARTEELQHGSAV